MATHFWQKLNLGIFSIFCLHEVAKTWTDYLKTFQKYLVNLRGVAGPYPFSENVKNIASYLFWYQTNFE